MSLRTAGESPEGRCQRSFIICPMNAGPLDVAQIRLDNALVLFDEFVSATVKYPDAATLRGLERRFAERLDIQPSYWSQIKGRSRQIGERLARQFEQRCHKPMGWMDKVQVAGQSKGGAPAQASTSASGAALPAAMAVDTRNENLPQDDDERFIVGLVLTYYRRHPQRARTRLLDLLGEVLTPTASPPAPRPAPPASDDAPELWTKLQAGIAPLKKKR